MFHVEQPRQWRNQGLAIGQLPNEFGDLPNVIFISKILPNVIFISKFLSIEILLFQHCLFIF